MMDSELGDERERAQAWRKFYQDAQRGVVNTDRCEASTWKLDALGYKCSECGSVYIYCECEEEVL